MKAWWCSLAVPPEPLTRAQRLAVLALTVVVMITRWLALARTLWDWDEALFSLALRHYDVAAHHPHPPGFPLYIATAKLFQLAGFSDFHALQAVSFLAGVAIVPAMFLLGRELRAGFRVSLIAAALLAFFPNVWLYGGMALSDVPSMTLVVLAVALLLRACRSDGALWGAAVVAAMAAGYRPQNLVIVLAPALIAAPHVLRRGVVRASAAVALGFAIIIASYAAAVQLSGGWALYRERLAEHQAYIARTDSFRAPGRPPLWALIDNFVIWPYRWLPINIPVATLVLVSGVVTLVRRRAPILVMLAAFGPFCMLAILLLDRFSVSRFSIGYAPLIALLAADGLELIFRRWSIVAAAALIVLMAWWTWPSLREVHTHPSPPVRAIRAIPAQGTVYVDETMAAYADLYLPKERVVKDEAPTALWRDGEQAWYLAEGEGAFRREHGALWDLVRRRYFDVLLQPVPRVVFGEGWYGEEEAWRWMARRSVMTLPPGGCKLTLRLYVPLDALPEPPMITVRVGDTVDRFRMTAADVERTYDPRGARELVIETTGAVRTPGDPRELGVRLNALEWRSGATAR